MSNSGSLIQPRPVEILAPCGSVEALNAALDAGTDAVYLGLPRFSARNNAVNFNAEELRQAVRQCRLSGVKVYLTLNTLVFDDEFESVADCIVTAAEAGVDAVIIQDLGVAERIKEITPEMPLHASTQMTITSVSGALEAGRLGFSRVVLARELNFPEISGICAACAESGVETEVFVHGALCSCVSGQCYMSAFFGDVRSANRGLCAQPCRLNFTAGGNKQHALSLKDLSLISHIKELEKAGVTSLKIEGRMKRPEYVAAAVKACREARAGIKPDDEILRGVFSRSGFTDGYFTGSAEAVADMTGIRGKDDVIGSADALKKARAYYAKPFKRHKVDFCISIRAGEPVKATASCNGIDVAVSGNVPELAENGKAAETERVVAQFAKLGGTVFEAGDMKCEISGGLSVKVSELNAVRRELISGLSERIIGKNTRKYKIHNVFSAKGDGLG